MTPKDWSLWITIGTLAATGISRFVSLEEAKTNTQTVNAAQDGRLEAQDGRLRALEQNRELERQIAALRADFAALAAEVRASQARKGR